MSSMIASVHGKRRTVHRLRFFFFCKHYVQFAMSCPFFSLFLFFFSRPSSYRQPFGVTIRSARRSEGKLTIGGKKKKKAVVILGVPHTHPRGVVQNNSIT